MEVQDVGVVKMLVESEVVEMRPAWKSNALNQVETMQDLDDTLPDLAETSADRVETN